MWYVWLSAVVLAQPKMSLWDYTAIDIDGNEVSFRNFQGKFALVINVASRCGFTDQGYETLVKLHDKYEPLGFTVLAFPCNDFGAQEPWEEARIAQFARGHKQARFPLFSKVHVNGEQEHPVFSFLKEHFPGEVLWNFHGIVMSSGCSC